MKHKGIGYITVKPDIAARIKPNKDTIHIDDDMWEYPIVKTYYRRKVAEDEIKLYCEIHKHCHKANCEQR